MSIFKDTFKQEIQNQLKARQDAILERTPTAIQYYNARNAWIRMSSAVNVRGSNELASKYILQGGILNNNNTQKSGVGNTVDNAYSTITPNGVPHRLGIRPMPGITSIEIKSKSAYGSLREVTVNFNAWDIHQLEDLELLYMRPGYTVLIEWGWIPYLDNSKQLQRNVDFTLNDIINKTPTKEQLFKNIYDTAVKKYNGNYDAMYGYIKNYSWSAREDGGYDCTTSIISVGEIMESLKVNYAPFNNISKIIDGGGLLITPETSNFISTLLANSELKEAYGKNILAGLFYEIWKIGESKEEKTSFTFSDKKGNIYNAFKAKININGGTGDASMSNRVGESDEQSYITLESLCNLINNHVTFKDSNSNSAYVTCSVFDREYIKDNTNTPNPKTGEGGYLLCLGHPLQISMDPSVCLINASFWRSGQLPSVETAEELNPSPQPDIVQYTTTPDSVYDDLIKEIKRLVAISDISSETENELIEKLSTVLKGNPNEVKELSRRWHLSNSKNLYDFLDSKLETFEINKAIGASNVDFIKGDPAVIERQKLEEVKKETEEKQKKALSETGHISFLKELNPFFYQDNYSTELGIIGNIYVNVNFLFRLALNNDLQSRDNKEQNDISLYDFLKSMLSEISSAIGNVNNFDIHVDPIDSVIRIIDVNYVDEKEREKVYKDLFVLEMHNLKSTVRTYKLESQIFPDQSSIIAIGAQVGGGAMATDNNTMLDFNKGLEDRITPKKIDPLTDLNQSTAESVTNQLKNLSSVFDIFYEYFSELNDTTIIFKIEDSDFDAEKSEQYKNALKDLIKFYQNLTKSNTKNRAIIPTKLSITMDGIGGLVIGHMFKIPEDLLPKGYKGETLGSKLGYVVTGIGHSISNNDWITNIDAQTIILDNPSGPELTFTNIVKQDERYKEVIETRKNETSITGGSISGNYIPFEKLSASSQAIIKSSSDLVLIREGATSTRTIGTLWYKQQVLGFTVEDAVRTTKIPKITAIPAGTFNITLDTTSKDSLKVHYVQFPDSTKTSFRFPGVFPRVGTTANAVSLIKDSLSFDGIRIHSGSTEKSSEGCIIYSNKRNSDGSIIKNIEHNKILTKLIYRDNIKKIIVINEFQNKK